MFLLFYNPTQVSLFTSSAVIIARSDIVMPFLTICVQLGANGLTIQRKSLRKSNLPLRVPSFGQVLTN